MLESQARPSAVLSFAAAQGLATPVSGVLHLLIGWIALQVACCGSGRSVDQSGALGDPRGQRPGTVDANSSIRSTELDGALRLLRQQGFGPWLLTAVALGIAAYGFYGFARARHARI